MKGWRERNLTPVYTKPVITVFGEGLYREFLLDTLRDQEEGNDVVDTSGTQNIPCR